MVVALAVTRDDTVTARNADKAKHTGYPPDQRRWPDYTYLVATRPTGIPGVRFAGPLM